MATRASKMREAREKKRTEPRKLPTEKEVEDRVAEAENLILRGWTERRVAAHIAERCRISVRAGYEYVYKVRERMAERAAARKQARDPDEIDAEHKARALALLDAAAAKGDLKAMGTAITLLARLDGRLTDKVTVSGKLEHKVEAGPDLQAQVDAVLLRHGFAPSKGDGQSAAE